MNDTQTSDVAEEIKQAVEQTLAVIDQEREREIVTRRFGLYERKETLEQIGELLGITRERVRQLEKAIMIRLAVAAEGGKIPALTAIEKKIVTVLSGSGRVSRVSDLSDALIGKTSTNEQRAQLAFLAELAPNLSVISENDHYYHAVGLKEYGNDRKYKENVDLIIKEIKTHGKPITAVQLHDLLAFEHPTHIHAHATVSKNLAHLKDNWGLTKWPTVNPKNIRDKIYVILSDHGKPLHFSEIADAIKDSNFKRRDVTTQAIHNELIKDKRFVLIGRGIYALNDWGFSRGTVSDIIADILKDAGEPLHRDEIVKRVLKSRQVKETTILLNLQSKPQFKRVAKATYTLADEAK
jgi:hypothetical protein